jgi:hypothetical protein
MEVDMHISIVRFPTVTAELDKEYRDWFASSNDLLRGTAGLKGRRLLRAPEGSYTAVIEHDGASTFAAVHAAEAVSMVQSGLGRILSTCPQAMTYEVVEDFAASGGCCAPTAERQHHAEVLGPNSACTSGGHFHG